MLRLDREIEMKYIINKKHKVAGANVRVGGQMRRAPACFDTPDTYDNIH